MADIDFYKIGNTPEEIRSALIELRSDFDSHNHDGSNSRFFETVRAESIISRIQVSGTPTSTRAELTASSLKFYSSTNKLLMTMFSRSIVFKTSSGAGNHSLIATDNGLTLQDDGGGTSRVDINANLFFFKKFEPLTDEDTVDIGTTTAGHRFRTIYLINSPDVSSSKEGKEKIRDIKYGLDTVLKMRPVSFVRKSKEKDHDKNTEINTQTTNLGFIAEEMNKIVPEASSPNSMKPDHLIPILVKAIQELTARVVELEKK